MSPNIEPPDKVLNPVDAGSDTQKRFRYQSTYAATLALDLLREGSEFDQIFCEQHEDILIKRKDGAFIGIQVKTRKLSKGPFTFNDYEIIKTLEGFIKCEKTFPGYFKNYVIAANCGFSNAPNDYRNLHLSMGNQEVKKISDTSFIEKLSTISLNLNVSKEVVLNVFKKVRLAETHGIEEYEIYVADQISQLVNISDYGQLRKAAIGLIDRMSLASSLHHSSPRSAYFAVLQDPDHAEEVSLIQSKCITKSTVEEILKNFLDKSKIEKTSKNKKAQSFPRTDVGQIDKSFKQYAERIVSDFENFSSFEREGAIPLIDQLSKFDLKKYYVPVKLIDTSNRLVRHADDLVNDWIDESELNGLFILGDFGTGKSTLCAHLVCQYALRYLDGKSERIPIFLSLRNIGQISEQAIIQAVNKMIKIKWSTLLSLNRSGKLLLILDGFDEMSKRTDWKKTLDDFEKIVNIFCGKRSKGRKKAKVVEKSKVIVTCRTHYFKKDSEVWGEDTELMKSLNATENFKIAFMEQFEKGQIWDLIRRRTLNPEEVWGTIEKTYNLKDLCKKPLLLDMIVSTLPKLVSLGLKINAATLYDSYTGNWIDREDWRSQLSSDQKSILMEKIACNIFLKDKPDITISEIEETIKNEFKTKPESDIMGYYDYDIRTCSFFRRDSEGNYSFMHRSFLEFFVAKAVIRSLNSNSLPVLMSNKLLTKEIVFFAGLLINPKSADVLLDALSSTKGKTLNEGGVLGGNSLNLYKEIRCSLENYDLSGVTIKGVNLRSFLITNCKFEKAQFESVDIGSTRLSHCCFINASFTACTLAKTDVQNTDFTEAIFKESQITNAVFSEATILSKVKFEKCEFNAAKIINSNLMGAYFQKSAAGAKRFLGDFGIYFIESSLKSAIFVESTVIMSIFYSCDLTDSRFTNSDFDGTCFYLCNCNSLKYDRGSISFASIIDSTFNQAVFSGTKFFDTFMIKEKMGSALLDQSSIKLKEKPLHRIRIKDSKVEVIFEKYVRIFCAVNSVSRQYSLSEQMQKDINLKFLKIANSTEKNISFEKFSLASAITYSAILTTNRPRTLREVANYFDVSSREISRAYRNLLKSGQVLRLRVSPKTLIEAYAKELNLSKKTEEVAKEILDHARKLSLNGRNPASIAASAIYLACKHNSERITEYSVAKIANLSLTTIGNTTKYLSEVAKTTD